MRCLNFCFEIFNLTIICLQDKTYKIFNQDDVIVLSRIRTPVAAIKHLFFFTDFVFQNKVTKPWLDREIKPIKMKTFNTKHTSIYSKREDK